MELLVVVAIIGVLVSILLPSLGRARESARRAVCLNNLRQQGVAHANYAADHNDFVVPWGYNGMGDEMFLNLGAVYTGSAWSGTHQVGPGLLYPDYVASSHSFYCPSNPTWDRSYATAHYWDPSPRESPHYLSSGTGIQITYVYLAGRGLTTDGIAGWGDNGKGAWKRITETNRTLAADRLRGGSISGAWRYDSNHPAQYWGDSAREPEGGHFLWTDGHVAWNRTRHFAWLPGQWVDEVWINGQRIGIYGRK